MGLFLNLKLSFYFQLEQKVLPEVRKLRIQIIIPGYK